MKALWRAAIQTAEVIVLLCLYINYGWKAVLCGVVLLLVGGMDFMEFLFDRYEVSEK